MGPEVASLHGQVAPPISSGTFRARGVQLTFLLIQEDDDFGRETLIIFNHSNLYLYHSHHSLPMRLLSVYTWHAQTYTLIGSKWRICSFLHSLVHYFQAVFLSETGVPGIWWTPAPGFSGPSSVALRLLNWGLGTIFMADDYYFNWG